MARTFAIIGDPIDHSLSPAMYNAAFLRARMDCTYMAYRIPAGELEYGLHSLRSVGVEGYNVTIPHKIPIMEYLDSVSEECSLVGAANLVTDREGVRRGFNVDMDGFLGPLKSRNISLSGRRVILLGAGGAARAAASGLAGQDVAHMHVCARNTHQAKNLASHCSKLGASVSSGPMPSYVEDCFDLVVNATPVGMNGGASVSDVSGISVDTIAYDMVYVPIRTTFLTQAEDAGAATIPGWEMLLEQAILSFAILHDRKAPADAMKRALMGGFA